MAFTKTHIRDIALAYLELRDSGRMFCLDDYMRPRDFSNRDKKLIRTEVKKLLIDRQQSETIKEGAASPVPLLSVVLGWEQQDEKRMDKTLPGLTK